MSYYFYYGDYVNGERKGNGTEFIAYIFADTTGYYVFNGEWNDDAPNGEGIVTEINVFCDYVRKSGTLIDGLWDGRVNVIEGCVLENIYEEFDLSFIAVNGVPDDRTEECMSEWGVTERPKEGYIYAFDKHPSADNSSTSIVSLADIMFEEVNVVGIAGFADKWW